MRVSVQFRVSSDHHSKGFETPSVRYSHSGGWSALGLLVVTCASTLAFGSIMAYLILSQGRRVPSAEQAHVNVWLALPLAGIAAVLLRLLAVPLGKLLHKQFDPWRPVAHEQERAAEETAFRKFAEVFATGPDVCEENYGALVQYRSDESESRKEFQEFAQSQLACMRGLVAELGRAPNPNEGQKVLVELLRVTVLLQEDSRLKVRVPLWQLASALQGFLQQLVKAPNEATASALRTVASALDLFAALCASEVRSDLATSPPVKILAVDDETSSRLVVAFALKQVFGPPDLAADGLKGLALAEEHAYDVIFLDIEMPGLNGFELCSRIHKAGINQNTPVVFLTSHSDFNSRVKSSLIGARELVGKPFLAFEVALKALTMVLQRRLQAQVDDPIGFGQHARDERQAPQLIGAEVNLR